MDYLLSAQKDGFFFFQFSAVQCRALSALRKRKKIAASGLGSQFSTRVVSCPDPTLSQGKGSGDYWVLPWLCRVSNIDF